MVRGMSDSIKLFRSKYETYLNCPRQRFLAYELEVPELGDETGITGLGISLYLALGSTIHEGLRVLFKTHNIDSALDAAKFYWQGELERGELQLEPANPRFIASNEAIAWERNQSLAIAEGLIYGFYKKIYPDLKERYEVLESEVDRAAEFEVNGTRYKWLVKLDLLMREIETNELIAMSFKSLSTWSVRSQQSYQISAQNFSEPWAYDQVMKRWWEAAQKPREYRTAILNGEHPEPHGDEANNIPSWFFRNGYDSYDEPPKINSMMMGVLLKGYRKKDEKRGEGFRNYYSPLVGGWKMDSGLGEPVYSAVYQRAKGWVKFNVWDEFENGARDWVDLILSGQVEVGETDGDNFLLTLFVFPEPLPNRDSFADRWVRQMVHIESRIGEQARIANGIIREGNVETALDYLDLTFPMNTKNCYQWGGVCPNVAICWERPEAIVEQSLLSNGYKLREPHHELEVDGDE